MSIDEITEIKGRCIAKHSNWDNININKPGEILLLTIEISEKANPQNICKLFEDSFLLLWLDNLIYTSIIFY